MRAMKTTIEVGFAMASASAKTTVMKPRQPNIDELLHALAISCGGWYSSSSSSSSRITGDKSSCNSSPPPPHHHAFLCAPQR
mmetsp:Transcript_74420/g.140874  ORF Transcript_74420/g.140874 Transcript_74420/m.140874 type:complete len:82 (+) Transcript_74420:953-1198(+)